MIKKYDLRPYLIHIVTSNFSQNPVVDLFSNCITHVKHPHTHTKIRAHVHKHSSPQVHEDGQALDLDIE